jgi:hypothetical protein
MEMDETGVLIKKQALEISEHTKTIRQLREKIVELETSFEHCFYDSLLNDKKQVVWDFKYTLIATLFNVERASDFVVFLFHGVKGYLYALVWLALIILDTLGSLGKVSGEIAFSAVILCLILFLLNIFMLVDARILWRALLDFSNVSMMALLILGVISCGVIFNWNSGIIGPIAPLLICFVLLSPSIQGLCENLRLIFAPVAFTLICLCLALFTLVINLQVLPGNYDAVLFEINLDKSYSSIKFTAMSCFNQSLVTMLVLCLKETFFFLKCWYYGSLRIPTATIRLRSVDAPTADSKVTFPSWAKIARRNFKGRSIVPSSNLV